MSYPRQTSANPFALGQISDRPTTAKTAQPPVRFPVNTADYPTQTRSANLQTPEEKPDRKPETAFINRHGSTSQRAIGLGLSAIALSLLAIIPAQVGSKSIDTASCEKKVLPTGQISRGQMSSLLALPTGSNKTAVRQVAGEPYCLLPAVNADAAASADKILAGAEREAYPLAFDPDAWVVLAYSGTGEYIGYDFVFK